MAILGRRRAGGFATSVLILGAVAAYAKDKPDAGKTCSAKSCDKEGNCEAKSCVMLDAAAESGPATKGKIVSCQG
jgi:hypothetical protein